MLPQLASQSFAVEDLFAAPFLYVSPAYQRPFAWQVDEAERLLSDVQSACASAPGDIYFLGAILLVRTPLDGEQPQRLVPGSAFSGPERIFEIVDGQQRIVTLSILLAVLRDLLGPQAVAVRAKVTRALGAVDPATARVRLRGPDSKFLSHCTGEPGACLVPPLADVASEPQRRMLDIRDFFVRQLKALEQDELLRLATFLMQNCAVVSVITTTIDRAYQMFTVLNVAGKPLTRNDILKAELIGQIAVADRGRATEVWDGLELKLGDRFEDLFTYVRTVAGRNTGAIVEAIRAEVLATSGGAASFVFDTLAPAGEIVDQIMHARHEGAPQSAAINVLLRYLSWLPGQEWVSPLLCFWLKHGHDTPALLAFLKQLDRFAFAIRVHGLGADKRAQRMATLIAQIKAGAAPSGPWPALQLTREELRGTAFSLRDLHRRSPQICRLVLMRLNEHFGGAPMPDTVPLTIEHILPLKVPATSQWRIDFPDADTRLKLATCLGNLTLVPARINERAANHDYAKKVALYFSPDAQPVAALTAPLRNLSLWRQDEIEERLQRLISGLNDIWQLDEAQAAR